MNSSAMPDKPDKTARTKARFLVALADSMTITTAARKVRISRETAYKWRSQDRKFAEGWQDAREGFADEVEDLIWKRAKGGDTRCLLRVAERVRPDAWCRNRQEIGGENPVEIRLSEQLQEAFDKMVQDAEGNDSQGE
jgi:transposase-like protein